MVSKKADSIIIGLITLVLIFEILSAFSSQVATSSTCIAAQSATYGGLVSLLGPGGILLTLMIIGVFYGLYKIFWSGK